MLILDNYLWVGVILLLSFAVSYLLYRKKESGELSLAWKYALGILRGFSVFFILLLLLSPILKCNKKREIKPKSIILLDNSSSIKNTKGNIRDYLAVANNLSKKYQDVGFESEVLCFDKESKSIDSFNGSGVKTDIFHSLETILQAGESDNLQQVTLITDGLYNEGNNPIFVANPKMTKLNTILLGDTTEIRDLKIEHIDHNPIVYSNEISQIQVGLVAMKAKGAQISMTLEEVSNSGSKPIQSQKAIITSDVHSLNVLFKLNNPSKGRHHYRIAVSKIAGELNVRNNAKDFFIEVVDGIKNIEIVSSFPHPDISSLKNLIESNRSFKVKLNLGERVSSFSNDADVIVLYQIPNQLNDGKVLIDKARSLGKSLLFVLGTQSNLNAFNQIQASYRVNQKGSGIVQDYFPILNSNFSKFYLSENTKLSISRFPPLSNHLLGIEKKTESSDLLYARLGTIATEQPLISIAHEGNSFVGLIAAENIWKWKVHQYAHEKRDDAVRDIIEKLINFLAIKKDKKQLVVQLSESQIQENEKLLIGINTFNEMYQPVKATKVSCIINNAAGRVSSTEIIPQENTFYYEPKNLNMGEYNYQVEAIIGGKRILENGSFTVLKDDIENQILPSNSDDMNTLALKSGGQFLLFNNIDSLRLDKKQDLKSELRLESSKTKMNDTVWALLLLLITLSLEWLLRKYKGLH